MLTGQVALVTGGASGIGRATVVRLASNGAEVIVADRDEAGLQELAEEVGAAARIRRYSVDLSEAGQVAAFPDLLMEDVDRIDILVNCAGISSLEHSRVLRTLDYTDEEFDVVMAINLRAPFMLTRAVGWHMIERGGGGRIVNVSSSAAFEAALVPAVYAASKAALNSLTRVAAADLGAHDINVNAVAPGLTKTPIAGGLPDEMYDELVRSGPLANPLQRPAEVDDVAAVIAFLCLPDARQITGQVLHTSAGSVV